MSIMYMKNKCAELYLTLLLLLLTPLLAISAEKPEATHVYSVSKTLHAPIRIAVDSDGNIYVTESRKLRVTVLDAGGGLVRYIYGVGSPLGIAVGRNNRLYIGDNKTGSVGIYTLDGDSIGKLGFGAGQFTTPTDMVTDSQNNVYVVDSKENSVKVFAGNGKYKFKFGSSRLQFPTGIAIDEANGNILVGQYGAIVDGVNAARIHIFDLLGEWKKSIGRYGGKAGEFTRIQGIAVDEGGRIYVADCFQSTVQVIDYAGNGLSFIGNYGDEPGELRLPSDVVIDSQNRLWVTSTNTGRVEVFALSESSPVDPPANGESRFSIDLYPGVNFISVPLQPKTGWRLSDLAAHIGHDVISIITYDPGRDAALSYLPGFSSDNDPSNIQVEGSGSYIIIMWQDERVAFQGTSWEGKVNLEKGMSMFAMPLQPGVEWKLSDLADYVGEELVYLITFDRALGKFETYAPKIDPPSNTVVRGGMGYLSVMSRTETVVFSGSGWGSTEEERAFAAPAAYSVTSLSSAPLLIVQGKVLNPAGRMDVLSAPEGMSIQVRNQDTGEEKTVAVNSNGDYVAAFIDFTKNRTASVGDSIQVKTLDSEWTVQSVPYELTPEDIQMSYINFPTVQLEAMPKRSMILQSYPNPANPETWIPYRLSEEASVRVEIYNISGQMVRTLDIGAKEAGNYVNRERAAYWDGNNNVGEAVASGIYFYSIRAGSFGATGRMVILK